MSESRTTSPVISANRKASLMRLIAIAATVVSAFIAGMLSERFVFAPISSLRQPPVLLTPTEGAVLKNGDVAEGRGLSWQFKWSPCPNARTYRLLVVHSQASVPLIDEETDESYYRAVLPGNRIKEPSLKAWKVKAEYDGGWSLWSEERSFDVEPPRE